MVLQRGAGHLNHRIRIGRDPRQTGRNREASDRINPYVVDSRHVGRRFNAEDAGTVRRSLGRQMRPRQNRDLRLERRAFRPDVGIAQQYAHTGHRRGTAEKVVRIGVFVFHEDIVGRKQDILGRNDGVRADQDVGPGIDVIVRAGAGAGRQGQGGAVGCGIDILSVERRHHHGRGGDHGAVANLGQGDYVTVRHGLCAKDANVAGTGSNAERQGVVHADCRHGDDLAPYLGAVAQRGDHLVDITAAA